MYAIIEFQFTTFALFNKNKYSNTLIFIRSDLKQYGNHQPLANIFTYLERFTLKTIPFIQLLFCHRCQIITVRWILSVFHDNLPKHIFYIFVMLDD